MLRFVTVLCLALAVADADLGFGSLAKSNDKFHPRVIGGSNAASGDFPWQVSMQLVGLLGNGQHYCGGSIITPKTVLSAGHCVTEVTIAPGQHVEAKAGLINLQNPGTQVQSSKVDKTLVNPYFPGGVSAFDVAIYILNPGFLFNSVIKPIALPPHGYYPSGTVTLSGWGSTSTGSTPTYPNELKYVDLPVVPFDECLQAVAGEDTPLDDSMVCTGPLTGGSGACSGDSGGPLVNRDGLVPVLVGIVSWGFIPCGQANLPSVFTNVGNHTEWIESNIV